MRIVGLSSLCLPIAMGLAITVAATVPGVATTRLVPSEYATIQGAVDASTAGDSVLVGSGTFLENVEVNIPIAILGVEPGATVSADGGDYCFLTEVAVDPLIVSGLTLVGASTSYGHQESGYTVIGGGRLIMSDCTVRTDGYFGTHGVAWGGDLRLSGCEFVGVGSAELPAVIGWGDAFRAEDCVFRDIGGSAIVAGATMNDIANCVFENVPGPSAAVAPQGALPPSTTIIRECLFVNTYSAIGLFIAPVSRRGATGALRVEGSTFVGMVEGALSLPTDYGIRLEAFTRNIVTAGYVGVSTFGCDCAPEVFSCNNVWGNSWANWSGSDLTGQFGNISAMPHFCGRAAGDYSLAENSPCLPTSSPCGELIGAFDQGCGATSVDPSSWGRVKAAYRGRSGH